jgi:hypothetical protein
MAFSEKHEGNSQVTPRETTSLKMQDKINRPIFVVGSPRSGTSILTWCLGHHTNLFPVPESNWMGHFAVNVALAYQTGAARGDYSILSAMDIQNEELFAAFGQSINDFDPAPPQASGKNAKRFVQANDQISQMSRQLHDKSVNLAEHEK